MAEILCRPCAGLGYQAERDALCPVCRGVGEHPAPPPVLVLLTSGTRARLRSRETASEARS